MATEQDVVALINTAMHSGTEEKHQLLMQVHECIFHQDAKLLDQFFLPVLDFHLDTSSKVRQLVFKFIDDASAISVQHRIASMTTLLLLGRDPTPVVLKRFLVSATAAYKQGFEYVVNGDGRMRAQGKDFWKQLCEAKESIVAMLSHPNELVSVQSIKGVETIVLTQTEWRETNNTSEPPPHPYVDLAALEAEARSHVTNMLFMLQQGGEEAGATKYTVIVNTLGAVCKNRRYMAEALLPALLALHVPPSFSNSQRASIVRALKTNFVAIFKSAAFVASRDALLKWLDGNAKDAADQLRKQFKIGAKSKKPRERTRFRIMDYLNHSHHNFRLGLALETVQPRDFDVEPLKTLSPEHSQWYVLDLLTKEDVARLVMANMAAVPLIGPSTLLCAPTSSPQVFAQVIETSLSAAELPSRPAGLQPFIRQPSIRDDDMDGDGAEGKDETGAKQDSGDASTKVVEVLAKVPCIEVPENTKDETDQLFRMTIHRILSANCVSGGAEAEALWVAVVPRLIVRYSKLIQNDTLTSLLFDFVFENYAARHELALHWLFEEWAYGCRQNVQQLSKSTVSNNPNKNPQTAPEQYCAVLDRLMLEMKQRLHPNDKSFTRLVLEAPFITENAFNLVLSYCTDSERVILGLATLRDLLFRRPAWRNRVMTHLLDFSIHSDESIRSPAIRLVTNKLFPVQTLQKFIIEFAVNQLKDLGAIKDPAAGDGDVLMKDAQPQPTNESNIPNNNNNENTNPDSNNNGTNNNNTNNDDVNANPDTSNKGPDLVLDETAIKHRLYLYFVLCTKQRPLLAHLVHLYPSYPPSVKALIRTQIIEPIKFIGQTSDLIEVLIDFPVGSESLVLHILNILTDRGLRADQQLVNMVWKLYEAKKDMNHPIRLLIPILTTLRPEKIIELLPDIVALPARDTELAIRTLFRPVPPVIPPIRVLIAIHKANATPREQIEAVKVCLSLEKVFTNEILAAALQQMVESAELSKLPVIFMRTVIEVMKRHTQLIGWVMSDIMASLVLKRVWEHDKLWQGFKICCEQGQPHSFGLLVTLPINVFRQIMDGSPSLEAKLYKHASHHKVPRDIMEELKARKASRSEPEDGGPKQKAQKQAKDDQ